MKNVTCFGQNWYILEEIVNTLYSVAANYMDSVGLPKTHVQLLGYFFHQPTHFDFRVLVVHILANLSSCSCF